MNAAATLKGMETVFLRLNQAVIVIMMIVMSSLVFANVVSRYAFGQSLNWSEEIARFLMIWITYLGAGLAMREGQHVAIEFFQGLLPPRFHVLARSLVLITILAFLAVLTVVGFQFSEFAWRQRSPVMQWRMGVVYLAIPLGSIMFALHLLIHARTYVAQTPGGIEVDADESASAVSAAADGGATLEEAAVDDTDVDSDSLRTGDHR